MRRVWLGADSVITAAGHSTAEVVAAVERGRVGCRMVCAPELWGEPFVAGVIDDAPRIEGLTRLESMMAQVIIDVLGASGVDAANTGLIIASTKGNIDLLPADDGRVLLGTMADRVARHCGFGGTPIVISNACVSGVSAVIAAARLIEQGLFDNVIVAGGDVLSRFVVTGFQGFRSVSGSVCKPYDAARDGLSLGEGCGALLLTSERGRAVEPAVSVAGGAISSDANHISGPSRTGDGLNLAIAGAMSEAGAEPSNVGFVNGHGTGTAYNDEMESKAFALAGLGGTPVVGLKPCFGHMLGASGLVETIISAAGLRAGIVWGTPGFENGGTTQPLSVSAQNRTTTADVCVKTASGFGGCNAAIVLRRGAGEARPVHPKYDVRCVRDVRITPNGEPFGQMIRARFKALESPDMKFFKMDDLSRLAYVAVSELLAGRKYAPEQIGIVLANRSASLDTDLRHARQIAGGAEASPAIFVYTLPNVAAAEATIRHKMMGEATFFIGERAFAEEYAAMLLRTGRLRAVVCGWCELLGEEFEAEMKLFERYE